MYQPIDGGAGAVHLLPSYFHLAVSGIPQLNQAYQREFSKRYPLSQLQSVVQTDPAFREQIGQLLSRQEYTFLVAGWWMTDGAQQTMGTQLGCGDLRVDMDRGLGETDSTAKNSGFYRVTECVYGTISDPGLAQRLQYYQSISDYASTSMKCQTTQCYQ
jgi:hypothetical protein